MLILVAVENEFFGFQSEGDQRALVSNFIKPLDAKAGVAEKGSQDPK
jgi:hypothetical protein